MRTVIKLELVADNIRWANKNGAMDKNFDKWLRAWRRLGVNKSFTWVKRVLPDGKKKTVQGVRDYSNANHNGSRGIYCYYALSTGIYEINHRYKFSSVRRYFIEVTSDGVAELDNYDG